jgi:hypothetical protein
MRPLLAFLGTMLAGAIVAHVAFSAAVSAWISHPASHRLFNVRKIDNPAQWGHLTRLFVEGQGVDDPRPKILMFGSSVTWGYSWPERNVLSWHMQKVLDRYQVLNVSIIGRDLKAISNLECYLQNLRTEVAIVTIELNLFNILDGHPDGDAIGCEMFSSYIALGGPLNYVHYTLFHPWGIEYFRAFWNEYEYTQPEQPFTWNPLPESYFPSLTRFLENQLQLDGLIRTAIGRANTISQHVATFVAPTLREGLDLSNYNPADLQRMADIAMEICTETGQSVCLDPSLDLPREDFGNLTHLNMHGHEDFALWLLTKLPLPTAAAVGSAR